MDLQKMETVKLDSDKPVLANGEFVKDEVEKEEKLAEEEDDDIEGYRKRVEKLEKLIKAKDNSIKTFITKNDALTSEMFGIKDLLYEKDMAFRSVSDSLTVVVERCNHKTIQAQEQLETTEALANRNSALQSEVDILKRNTSDLESEVVDYQKLNEENNDAYRNQKKLLRKREEELIELRRGFEEKMDRQTECAASVKKQAERCSGELGEVREQLRKLKEKSEKEKDVHFEEIQTLEKEKSEILSKLTSAENQLKKSREEYLSMANNLTFTESDFHALQLKFMSLSKDNVSLKSDLNNQEIKTNSLSSENKSLKKELEGLKIDHDTLVQQKVSHNNRIAILQRELEDEKDKGLKNNHMIEELKRQCQQHMTELNVVNTRSDVMAKSTLDEEEEYRRKWQTRLKDAEDETKRLVARLKVSEKTRAEQCADIEQVSYDLSQTKRTLGSLEKKHEHTEVILKDHVALDQENREQIDAMKRRLNDYMTQIGNLKQEKEEDVRQQRDLRNTIKSLTDRVEDLEHEQEVSERKKQEMARQVSRLQEQIETANSNVTDLTDDIEKTNSRAEKAHKEHLLATEKQSNVLADKDEEIEMVKNTCRGTINLLKNQLEAAEQEISKLNLMKKELEGEILFLQGDLDEAEATVNELNNEIPRQQDILEQLNMSLGEATVRCEALQEALVRADLKCTQLSARNDELEDELNQGEMEKRLTDQDNIDLHNKITEQTAKGEALLDTIAKVEAQLEAQTSILEAMETDKTNWERERRKMRELINTLDSDNQHLEEVRMCLETSENKLKFRLRDAVAEHEDTLKAMKNANRARTRVLEGRVAELEANLEEETERRTELEKAVKRIERLLKEVELQAKEDTQTIERQVEHIANVNNRNKQLKTQFGEAEARVTSMQSKLRKVTSEVEESENRNVTMTKLLSTPSASRCSTPSSSFRHSAIMRNSVLGSRPTSRLISSEVEHILLSGRNSPVGPLSILSGRNSPAPPSPLLRATSPAPPGNNTNKPAFEFEEESNKQEITESKEDYGHVIEQSPAPQQTITEEGERVTEGEQITEGERVTEGERIKRGLDKDACEFGDHVEDIVPQWETANEKLNNGDDSEPKEINGHA